jgi:hypothetical protein
MDLVSFWIGCGAGVFASVVTYLMVVVALEWKWKRDYYQ